MPQEILTYTNELGNSITFSALGLYHMKNVTGLSDMKNTIFSISAMGQDGDTYVGSRIESRDIEIVGAIRSRNTLEVQNLRRRLYQTMNPKLKATLTYTYGAFSRVIDCTPDNAPVFRNGPVLQEFTIQLSCLNPFWRDPAEIRMDMAAWYGLFEFELEIPMGGPLTVSGDQPARAGIQGGIEMGSREPSLILNVHNDGDVPTGMRVDFRATGSVVNPELFNLVTREFLLFNMTLIAGDVLSVSTHFANKTIILYRGGVEINAFRYFDADSTFIQLNVGDNIFRYGADVNSENLEVSIYFNNQYLGV